MGEHLQLEVLHPGGLEGVPVEPMRHLRAQQVQQQQEICDGILGDTLVYLSVTNSALHSKTMPRYILSEIY